MSSNGSRMNFETFLSMALRSGLLTCYELRDFLNDFLPESPLPSLEDVDLSNACDALITRKLLTRWQCDMLQRGKHKGFLLDHYKLLDRIDGDELRFIAEDLTSMERVVLLLGPHSEKTGRIEYSIVE